ncbi:MAG: type IX secretion system membrane protein PorP/SprF [Bacteroidales bacterium]|nr:type IX secretion system membrane protein PorP/SprF [Bacteroidales bacterium]
MRNLIIFIFLILNFTNYGQIINYIGILDNPAEAGIEKQFFYLQQNSVSQLPGAPSSHYGGISHLFINKKTGTGKILHIENVGAGGIFRIENIGFHSDIRLEGLYSFRIGSENHYINFGLSPTLHRQTYKLNKLNPKDPNDALLEYLPENSGIFDMNIGIHWYWKPVYISLAAYDIINHELCLNDHFYNVSYQRTFKGRFTYKYENEIISLSPSLLGHWHPKNDYSLIIHIESGFFKEKITAGIGTGVHDFGRLSEILFYGSIGYGVGKIKCFVYYGNNTSGLYRYSQGDLGIGVKYYFFNEVRNIEK